MVTIEERNALYAERPRKFTAQDVGYEPSQPYGIFRCSSCLSFYVRLVDLKATCDIFRSPETDEKGVDPGYRCRFWTTDGETFPMLKEEKEKTVDRGGQE